MWYNISIFNQRGVSMLDLNTTFSAPGSITTPYMRSFMSTFCVGIRNRIANSSSLHNMYVKAKDLDEAAAIASLLIKPYDMIVKSVIAPGDEIYGLDEGDPDPLPTTTRSTFHINTKEF